METLRRGEGLLRNSSATVVPPPMPSTFLPSLSPLELERLKVELQSRDEKEEEEEQEGDQENRQEEEQRKLTVVEELKEELQQFHKRRRDEEETHQSRAFAAVRREVERQEWGSEAALQVSLTPTHRLTLYATHTANCLVPSFAEVRAASPSSRTGRLCLAADVQRGQQEEEPENHRKEEEEL